MTRIIYHIDCNSAYLSWQAAYNLQQGDSVDLREIPAIIGGNEVNRHGIVLAKSIPAKVYGIKTGESIREAFEKYPKLVSVPPNYHLYMKSSNALVSILSEYSDMVQRFSIDECFVDVTNTLHLFHMTAEELAHTIRKRVHDELGFTVNIGISTNKLLAKMASDFKKPNRVHTLYPAEIKTKMWPLPVRDLFMVGSATMAKLFKLGIYTIGELANSDLEMIESHLKSHGNMVWHYANGLEDSNVRKNNYEFMKGVGNGTTIAYDVDDPLTAYKVLLSLSESVGMRLRQSEKVAGVISVSITTSDFSHCSHQRKLKLYTDTTTDIYEYSKVLFNELWGGKPIRKLRIRLSDLMDKDCYQISLYEDAKHEKQSQAERTMDSLRQRFGSHIITRGCFVNTPMKGMTGGVIEEDYPMMASIL